MTTRYTVQQLATLSGVSVRTLHYYDKLGLLVPAFLGDNGYRYYGAAELLRLQQILLHREFGIALTDIGTLLEQSGPDRLGQLRAQKARLESEAARYRLLVETIGRTIDSLSHQGEHTMEHADLYKGFSPGKQAAYEAEAASLYGKDAVDQSIAAVKARGPAGQQKMMDELAEIELAIAARQRHGTPASDPDLAPLVERHRLWVGAMWGKPCTPQAHAELADMYASHPDFRSRYEAIAAGFTDYLVIAIKSRNEH
jgi:DNA-binding transcriptional MerR regulator